MIPESIPSYLREKSLSTTFEFMLENGFSNPQNGKSWSVERFLEASGFGRATYFRLTKGRDVRKHTVERAADCLLQDLDPADPRLQLWKNQLLDCWRARSPRSDRFNKDKVREQKIQHGLTMRRLSCEDKPLGIGAKLQKILTDLLTETECQWGVLDLASLQLDLSKENLRSASARLIEESQASPHMSNRFVAETLLGEIELERLNLGDALKAFEHAATIVRTPQSLARAGEVAWMIGHFDQAIALEDACLEIVKETFGAHHELTAQAHNSLGISLAAYADFGAAIYHYKEALRIRNPENGGSIEAYARCLNNLSAALVKSGRGKEAHQYCSEVLEIRQNLLSTARRPETTDSASIDLSRTLHVYGWLLQSLGQSEDAERQHREALRLRRTYCESNSYLMSQSLFEVGRSILLSKQPRPGEDLKEAETMIASSISMHETIVGSHDGEHALRRCFLQWCSVLQGGSVSAAILICEGALADLLVWYGDSHPDYLDSRSVMKAIEAT